MKRFSHSLYAAVAILALGAAVPAAAQDKGACCVFSTTKLDSLMNPVTGGDEDFFTSVSSGVPNVEFLLDNSGSMLDWPFALCPGNAYDNGCACPALNNLGYTPSTTYAKELSQLNSSSVSYYDNMFVSDHYYPAKPTRTFSDQEGFGYVKSDFYGNPGNTNYEPAATATTAATACVGTTDPAACLTCLNTRGYWLDDDYYSDGGIRTASTTSVNWNSTSYSTSVSNTVFKGNFLNLFAPKYLMARKVIKEVVRDIRPTRMMLDYFWDNDSSPNTRGNEPPVIAEKWNPTCNHPSNSNFFSNRQSIVSDLGGVKFGGTTPLSRALLVAGYAFTEGPGKVYASQFGASVWPRWAGKSNESDFSEFAGGDGVCNSCSFSAIIVLTDGAPNDSYEGSFDGGTDIAVTGCGSTCTDSKLDEIARFLYSTDLRTDFPGKQRVATFTIGFALNAGSPESKLLQSAATVGGGEAYNAKTSTELKAALSNIFDSINQRNTAFSAANIASLQTQNVTLSAIIPRMRPQKNAPWVGQLYRFNQYNEFVQGAEHPDDNDPPDSAGYLSEIFLVDSNNSIVVEDPDTGSFVRRSNPTQLAQPFWEAGARISANGYGSRTIYTVVDNSSANDGVFADDDSVITFDSAHASTLLPYMGLSEPGLCPNVQTGDLGSILGTLLPTDPEISQICGGGLLDGGFTGVALDGGGFGIGQNEALLCCAKVVIEWTRGRDMGYLKADGGAATRDNTLGDIFHSSPISVDPPATRFQCDLGISGQCVRTLYSDQLGVASTDHATTGTLTTTECGAVPGANQYDVYAYNQMRRDRLVLVGANDGMLHAFHNGNGYPVNDGGYTCLNGMPRIDFTSGTGNEVWAFIPPDQLPRLHERIFKHTYYVDGDVMVRDIWADTNHNGQKESTEFKTMAIAAEGRGGTHYFALQLNWDGSGNASQPSFRWMFPQPCSPEAPKFGKTLLSIAPKPPPIGPVLLGGNLSYDGSGNPSLQSGAGAGSKVRYNQDTSERYVVMLSGGWSPFLEKGRGVYMVDAYSSKVNGRSDNLWWKAEYNGSATGSDAPKAYMTHSFAAPVAMIDYGSDQFPKLDGFFDTFMVGDTRGQVWLGRMYAPATVDATTKLINNWPISRVFEMDQGNTASVSPSDLSGSVTGRRADNIFPFYYLPSAALQLETGQLRAFMGTGNRYGLLDDGVGTCGVDNPAACSKYMGCTSIRSTEYYERLDQNYSRIENHWQNNTDPLFVHASADAGASLNLDYCGTDFTQVVHAGFSAREIICASSGANMPLNVPTPTGSLGLLEYRCGKQGIDAGFYCWQTDGGSPFTDDYQMPDASLDTGLGANRFFGFVAYGGVRKLGIASADGGILDPSTFDNYRTTDRNGDAGTQLVDVTNVNCTLAGCDGGATPAGVGWFYQYDALKKKTASGSAVLASCVLWSSIYPSTGSDGGCANTVNAAADLFQGDFITGQPNCAAGFLTDGGYTRSQSRDVSAPPPEPSVAIMVGPNNQVKYSVVLVEPGKGSATQANVAAGSDLLQTVYELPVSRQLHMCRHTTDGGCDNLP